ncbi:MAG: hypothetical protein AB7O65_11225 [Candidatus Korobacteraceae bacterium]
MKVLLSTMLLAVPGSASWAEPKPSTLAQLQHYLVRVEQRIAHEQSSTTTFLPEVGETAKARLRAGEVLVKRSIAVEVKDGLIHHWTGTVFLPGATLDEVQAVVADIGSFPRHYSPEVISARVVSRSPQGSLIAMRLKKDLVITVVLDAEYQVEFGRLDARHQYSASRSVRIREVRNFGKPGESYVPEGEEHGFLWSMNSYWRYVQAEDGVYIRCESVSLSRDIPFGMGWLIGPIVNGLPRESLRSTLEATRRAVLQQPRVSISSLERSR